MSSPIVNARKKPSVVCDPKEADATSAFWTSPAASVAAPTDNLPEPVSPDCSARIARRAGVDLEAMLQAEYGRDRPEELSLAEASRLIDRLRSEPAA